jgi:hypothetical protein
MTYIVVNALVGRLKVGAPFSISVALWLGEEFEDNI